MINAAISVLSAFLETEVHKEDTLGEFLFEWLDVSLAVSEDCLHLAVNTPRSVNGRLDLVQGTGVNYEIL